ncbi:MAG: hypothetical protein Q7U54_04420 [Bacteroidales bacterium]|nr:hypothetical protein [Bacteroidales bacterium]
MAVFTYNRTLKVARNDDVNLTINHPDPGTASYHLVDRPIANDLEGTNEAGFYLGKGEDLYSERTVIYSKAVNMDQNNLNINLIFSINDGEIVTHTNPKSIDPSPQIKINLIFVEL